MKKIIGIILIVIGVLGFAVTGISFTTTEEVADVGPIEIEREEERTIPIGPVASGVAVVAGVSLLAFGTRETDTP